MCLRWALRWLVVLGVYAAAFAYVAWRVVKDWKFWRCYLGGARR